MKAVTAAEFQAQCIAIFCINKDLGVVVMLSVFTTQRVGSPSFDPKALQRGYFSSCG
jgi:hypothetical protein